MTPAVGKFDRYPLMRQTARWEWVVEEVFSFHDPVMGVITCPAPSPTDLASIRFLREVFRWGAILAVVFGIFSAAFGLPVVLAIVAAVIAALAVLLYAYIAGYGNRMSAMHDFLYRSRRFPKAVCDQILWRMARTGEGMARPRAAVFYLGPVLGGRRRYGRR
ncbi:hypothetical protein V6W80_11560 [Pseudomonas benzopyrenica]|uniref:Conjugative transfer region protein, TIGR03750 family n=1 Tax=Pseudomonas benzopyrenica TaxID=2993566 RepID=A0ABZ2FY98_9PSED